MTMIVSPKQGPPEHITWFEGEPTVQEHEYYGKAYSVPVWTETGRAVRWSFGHSGWVDYLWRDGTKPEKNRDGSPEIPKNVRWVLLPPVSRTWENDKDSNEVVAADRGGNLTKPAYLGSSRIAPRDQGLPVILRTGIADKEPTKPAVVRKRPPTMRSEHKRISKLGNGDLAAVKNAKKVLRANKLRKAGADAYAKSGRK